MSSSVCVFVCLFVFVRASPLFRNGSLLSKCDVSQQITAVDGRYMLDIVVGERVEFIILSNERIVQTVTCMIHTVTLDLAYVDPRLFIRPTVSTV